MAEGDPRRKPHKIVDGVELKHCHKCGEWKELDCFVSDSRRWDGRKSNCRVCSRKATFEWRDKNRKHTRAYNIQWNKDNPDKTRASKERRKAVSPEKIKEEQRRASIKRKSTIGGRLQHRVSNLMRVNLKRNKQGRKWDSIIDYSLTDLIKRLTKTMPSGYTWQDFMDGKLHIDHIVPVVAFNFSSPNDIDFKRCWSLKNLRLLPAKENILKSDFLEKPFQPSLALAV